MSWQVFAGVALVALVLHCASGSLRDQLGEKVGVPIFLAWCVLLGAAVIVLVVSASSAGALSTRPTQGETMKPALLALVAITSVVGAVAFDGLDPPDQCSADTSIEQAPAAPELVADVDVARLDIEMPMVVAAPEPFAVEPACIEAMPRATERPPGYDDLTTALVTYDHASSPTTGGALTGRFAGQSIPRG